MNWEILKNLKLSQLNMVDVITGCTQAFLVDWDSPLIQERVKLVAAGRLKICANCHMNVGGSCDNSGKRLIQNVETGAMTKGCGCMVKCKTVLLKESCPALKWKAVI